MFHLGPRQADHDPITVRMLGFPGPSGYSYFVDPHVFVFENHFVFRRKPRVSPSLVSSCTEQLDLGDTNHRRTTILSAARLCLLKYRRTPLKAGGRGFTIGPADLERCVREIDEDDRVCAARFYHLTWSDRDLTHNNPLVVDGFLLGTGE